MHQRKQPPLPRMAQKAIPSTHDDQPSTPHSSGGESTAILLLASGVTRGPEGPTLELHPFTRVIEVEWVAPPDESVQSFVLSISVNGKILAKVKQDGPLKTVEGKRVAIFHLTPPVFTGNPPDSHFVFILGADDIPHSAPAEFAVSVSRQ